MLAAWWSGSPALSQEIDTGQADLTLERIFDSREFQAADVEARWVERERPTAVLEDVPDGGTDLVRYDVATGQRTVLVPAQTSRAARCGSPAGASTTTPGPRTARCVLIYTNSQRVWRQNTRGDYWLLDRTSRQLRQLGGDAPPASLMFATHLAHSPPRGVRARSEYLGRRPARSLHSPLTTHGVARHHQRHVRLGV